MTSILSYAIVVILLSSFSAVFFLAIRLRPVIQFLGGIAAQYRLHHILGLFCILTVTLHVFFQFAGLPPKRWGALFSYSDPGLIAAWIAFVFIITAFYGIWLKRISYRVWRYLHLLFIPAYLLGLIHAWLYASSDGWKGWLLFALALSGVVVLLMNGLSHFFPSHQRNFSITSVESLGTDIFELDLSPSNGVKSGTEYPAGQIVYVRFNAAGFTRSWHPFSVASCRTDPILRLVIKSFGHDTRLLRSIGKGDNVSVAGPFSEFRVSPGERQIWIAGGIGIAPFLGMVRCLRIMPHRETHLLYFVNSEPEAICRSELDKAASDFPNFTWSMEMLPRGAAIKTALLPSLTHRFRDAQFLVCGPPGFMRQIRKLLRRENIAGKNIHTEEFSTW